MVHRVRLRNGLWPEERACPHRKDRRPSFCRTPGRESMSRTDRTEAAEASITVGAGPCTGWGRTIGDGRRLSLSRLQGAHRPFTKNRSLPSETKAGAHAWVDPCWRRYNPRDRSCRRD